ncbi:unnamed protein product [Mesocestoides corti]|uniref:ESF1 RRM domain-containing protein n=1 Tax=Mesocestoides corti TaxID=53468 RepID=A0A0R3UEG1_MESCO|nr:unnamed protein product [Mesocestoides corti]
MDEKELDQISRDPRFAGRLKKKTKQEKEAFKSLFEGIEDEETYKDKRGRPWSKRPLKYAKQLVHKEEESDEEEESSSTEEASLSSDISSSAGEDVEENLVDLQDADWYALVKDVKEVEESTRRLAVLHFDWDNSNAETIFLALESFLPPGACLEKVTIYPSDYGMRKMAEEEQHGPRAIWEKGSSSSDEDFAKHEEGNHLAADVEGDEKKAWKATSVQLRRRLRKYQLQRLKYFYAIAEFDSKETASTVYEACDGVEYASTGIRFDLRFVNDDETFSVPSEWSHLVSECSEVNRAKYKPHAFENSALHSTRITLGWDRTPAARTLWLREQFEADADPRKLLTEGKLKEYLALSSSGQSTAAPSDVDEPGPAPTVPRIRRHRPPKVPPDQLRAALLSAISEDGGGKNEGDGNDEEQGDEDEESEDEEVEDLNADGVSSASEDEQYDLTAENEEGGSARRGPSALLLGRGGRKAVLKRRLPEAEDSDSSLDFDDMEDRVSDASGSDDGGRKKNSSRRRREDANDADANDTSKRLAKKKTKLALRKKIQMKKKKQERNQERLKDVWTGANEADSRFDAFLTDPAFGVNQMHRSYREATEFLNFMRRRRAPLRKVE